MENVLHLVSLEVLYAGVTPVDLAVHASKALLEEAKVSLNKLIK
jgi:hypothetical protein